jgi:hypothetical protein
VPESGGARTCSRAPGDSAPGMTMSLPVSQAWTARTRAPAALLCREARQHRHPPPPTSPTAILILEPPSYPLMARRVRVQKLPNGQFVVTVPKALAEAIGFRRGEQVQWSIGKDGLLLRRLTGKR